MSVRARGLQQPRNCDTAETIVVRGRPMFTSALLPARRRDHSRQHESRAVRQLAIIQPCLSQRVHASVRTRSSPSSAPAGWAWSTAAGFAAKRDVAAQGVAGGRDARSRPPAALRTGSESRRALQSSQRRGVFDVGVEADGPYVVSGAPRRRDARRRGWRRGALSRRARPRPRPRQTARGLAAAHQRGIVPPRSPSRRTSS